MTGREWQPGDVAMVTCSDGNERRALYGEHWLDGSGVWLFRDGTRRNADDSDARPLVVIDPEDREQVERLADLVTNARQGHKFGNAFPDEIDNLRAALREFANPTPPKPMVYEHVVYQQRGKTVEAVCGKLWIPDPEVTIVGRCPSCREIAGRWVA